MKKPEILSFLVQAELDFDRIDTAHLTKKIEKIIDPFIGQEVVGYRTSIARSRRGGAVEENSFRMIVEIVPKEKRKKSADQLIQLWKPDIDKIKEIQKFVVQKSRWGHASGSPIEIIIQENR